MRQAFQHRPHAAQASRGAALISAMITVTLVASLASAALWQQWRQVEIETAERSRAQTAWLLTGALDFTRLVLREDKGPADHLAEPWALGLQESKLSTFLTQDKQTREGDPEVYLSGQITDAQSRLNVLNLIDNDKLSPTVLASWTKLFNLLGLPLTELNLMSQQLLAAQRAQSTNTPASTRLREGIAGWVATAPAETEGRPRRTTRCGMALPGPAPGRVRAGAGAVDDRHARLRRRHGARARRVGLLEAGDAPVGGRGAAGRAFEFACGGHPSRAVHLAG
jgi:hypothetical protein